MFDLVQLYVLNWHNYDQLHRYMFMNRESVVAVTLREVYIRYRKRPMRKCGKVCEGVRKYTLMEASNLDK